MYCLAYVVHARVGGTCSHHSKWEGRDVCGGKARLDAAWSPGMSPAMGIWDVPSPAPACVPGSTCVRMRERGRGEMLGLPH